MLLNIVHLGSCIGWLSLLFLPWKLESESVNLLQRLLAHLRGCRVVTAVQLQVGRIFTPVRMLIESPLDLYLSDTAIRDDARAALRATQTFLVVVGLGVQTNP